MPVGHIQFLAYLLLPSHALPGSLHVPLHFSGSLGLRLFSFWGKELAIRTLFPGNSLRSFTEGQHELEAVTLRVLNKFGEAANKWTLSILCLDMHPAEKLEPVQPLGSVKSYRQAGRQARGLVEGFSAPLPYQTHQRTLMPSRWGQNPSPGMLVSLPSAGLLCTKPLCLHPSSPGSWPLTDNCFPSNCKKAPHSLEQQAWRCGLDFKCVLYLNARPSLCLLLVNLCSSHEWHSRLHRPLWLPFHVFLDHAYEGKQEQSLYPRQPRIWTERAV